MRAELRLKMVALVAALVCLIVLALPYEAGTHETGAKISCGNVFAPEDNRWCDGTASSRLTIAFIVGAVGVVACYGASQVKKREGQ